MKAKATSQLLSFNSLFEIRELEGRGRVIDVIFLEKKNGLEKIVYPYCTYCETTDCLHADYAFEIPEVRRILQQHGIKKRMKGKEIEEV